MIWWGPGHLAGGRRVGEMVSFVDFMPTVLELGGAEAPRGVQGRSFRKALTGEGFEGRDAVLLEDDDADNQSFCRTIRTARHQMTTFLPEREGELYDMQEDPKQLVNRYNDPGYREVKGELFERMTIEMMQACDPKPEQVSSV